MGGDFDGGACGNGHCEDVSHGPADRMLPRRPRRRRSRSPPSALFLPPPRNPGTSRSGSRARCSTSRTCRSGAPTCVCGRIWGRLIGAPRPRGSEGLDSRSGARAGPRSGPHGAEVIAVPADTSLDLVASLRIANDRPRRPFAQTDAKGRFVIRHLAAGFSSGFQVAAPHLAQILSGTRFASG